MCIFVSLALNRAEGGCWCDSLTNVATRRVHAAGQPPYRSLALSGCVAGCEFQFPAPQTLRPDAGARTVRRVLHGGSSGRAQHAHGRPQAQRDRHLLRSLNAATCPGRRDGAPGAHRHRLHDLQRAVSYCAEVCLAGSHQWRAGGLERGDLGQPA